MLRQKYTFNDLREALLLQICDDALANKVRSFDDMQHFFIVIAQECKFEPIFRGIDSVRSWSSRTIKAVHRPTLHAGQVYRIIQGADNTSVTRDAKRSVAVQRAMLYFRLTLEASSI